jgi:sulfatase modifying factor 1
MKKALMYDKCGIEKPIIELNKSLWNHVFYISKSVNSGRHKVNKVVPTLIPFEYEGIKFNMITCPAGGKVQISEKMKIAHWVDLLDDDGDEQINRYYWGKQEIKVPFMLGETEVTQELFEAVMEFNYSRFKYPENPVELITWYDCLEFCNRLSDYFRLGHCYIFESKEYSKGNIQPLCIEKAKFTFVKDANGFRLPKEWEWQIAAMAGTNNRYAGVNSLKSLNRVAWFNDNSNSKYHPVAQKLPNEWGFYDMSGNLQEWCENSKTPIENDIHSTERVIRGGSWYNEPSGLLSDQRQTHQPGWAASYCFRVARSIYSPEQLDNGPPVQKKNKNDFCDSIEIFSVFW